MNFSSPLRSGSRRAIVLAAGVLLSGCVLLSKTANQAISGPFPGQAPLVSDTSLNLTKQIQIPLEKIVAWGMYAGTAWLILDPMAPNWEIEQANFPEQHYHLSLKMKRVYTGGAGEARVVFHQRAKELMRENGYDTYSVVEYSEGLESSIVGSQRVASGVIQLARRPAPKNS